jgi:hypothetical protein
MVNSYLRSILKGVKLFSKRSILGTLIFLILAGESNVGGRTGLFSPRGFIALFLLYFCFFHLIDALVYRYNINALGTVLLTFSLYSVLITGLLHNEIETYLTHPHQNLIIPIIISLIRIQASLYTLFAFWLLKKLAPHKPGKNVSVKSAFLLFVIFILLITPTRLFGLWNLSETLRTAPVFSVIFIIAAVISFLIGIRLKSNGSLKKNSRSLTAWSMIFFFIALVPILQFYIILALAMTIVALYYLFKPSFRSMSVAN